MNTLGPNGVHFTEPETDWYIAKLDAGVAYRFEIATGKPYYLLTINNDQGTELKNSSISGTTGGGTTSYLYPDQFGILTYTPTAAGTYYVSVSAPGGEEREYTLTVRTAS